jgi:glycosyltransferase involved in cell wall biosynthesis
MVEERPSRRTQLQLAAYTGTTLVVLSETMKKFYVQNCRLDERNVFVIENGIRLSRIQRSTQPQWLKAVLSNHGSETLIFAVVGRLVELKRVDLVIRCFDKAFQRNPNFALLIVGEGPLRSDLEALARDNPCIHFLGYREDVRAILEQSDVFVQFSRTEGVSLSILEAMRVGLPCLLSNVGSNSELVQDALSAVLLEPGDERGLIAAMRSMRDVRLRKELGSRARLRAAETYDISKTIAKYFALYHTLGVTQNSVR